MMHECFVLGAARFSVVLIAYGVLGYGYLAFDVFRPTRETIADVKPLVSWLDGFGEATMPGKAESWQRHEFASEQRNAGSGFGEFSRIWRYRNGKLVAD